MPINQPSYYGYSHTWRVDAYGNGDFLAIPDACAYVATLPRDLLNSHLIEVNVDAYLGEIEVPSYTTLRGLSKPGVGAGNSPLIAYGLGAGTLPASERQLVTLNTGSKLENLFIATGWLSPANFDVDYAIVRANGESVVIHNCSVLFSGLYTGANPRYGFYGASASGSHVVTQSIIGSGGSGSTCVYSNCSLGIYYTQFFTASGFRVIDLNHTGGASGNSTRVVYCRTVQDDRSAPLPTSIIHTRQATTYVDIYSTYAPLDRRTGLGVVTDWNPTPQQIKMALTANVRTVAVNTTASGYTDGTIRRTAGDITLPPTSEVILGQAFAVANDGATSCTLFGNGANTINGAVSITLPANGRVIAQNTSTTTWITVADNRYTIAVQEEGVAVANTPHSTINFVGMGVTAADAGGGVASVTITDAGGGNAYGHIYVSTPVLTDIVTMNVPVKVAGTTTAGTLAQMDMPTDGRLRYTGSQTAIFSVTASVTLSSSVIANHLFNIYLALDGTYQNSTKSRTSIRATGDQSCVSITTLIQLAQNNYIEVFVDNATDSVTDVTAETMLVTAIAIKRIT